MNPENPKEIISKINQSGFPLEIEAFNRLRSAGFYAESGNYIDEDSGESRELDLEAAISFVSKDLVRGGFLMTHLIIQCKSLARAWVFFDNTVEKKMSPGIELFRNCNCGDPLFNDFLKKLEDKKKLNDIFLEIQGKGKLHKSFLEIPTNKNKELYEAIITTVKAKRYFQKLYSREEYGGVSNLIRVFLPVIITDKIILWSISLQGKKTKEINLKDLKKVKFILLSYGFLGKDREWEGNTVFITSIEYLDHFIREIKELSKFINKEWDFFRKNHLKQKQTKVKIK